MSPAPTGELLSQGPELFFSTGNNLPLPHDSVTNILDSVVRVSGTDASVIGVFTPTNVGYLDRFDIDIGQATWSSMSRMRAERSCKDTGFWMSSTSRSTRP